MALITCPDCARELSSEAPACPHCGRPNQTFPPPAPPTPVAKRGGSGCLPALGLLGLLGFAFVAYCTANARESLEKAREAARQASPGTSATTTGGGASPATVTKPTGKWDLRTAQSSMDDSKTVHATLQASNSIEGWPRKTVKPTLFIRCKERKTEVFVQTDMPANPELGKFQQHTVQLRLDKKPATSVTADAATSNDALFLGGAAMAKRFLGHTTLVFRFTPYNSPPQDATFDLTGIGEAVKPVKEACGW